ncbi:hypothetical protein CBR65_13635 [Cellvibrio sp. PSBB006]|nr:hypothetical protein CBR65_13635 [Cellvibrio sp. PSBB006]
MTHKLHSHRKDKVVQNRAWKTNEAGIFKGIKSIGVFTRNEFKKAKGDRLSDKFCYPYCQPKCG